jgi:hypothetical protein
MQFILTIALLLASMSLMAQKKEQIQQNIIGKWAWTKTVKTPGNTSVPMPDKVITPESCDCQRRFIITEDQVISEKPLTENVMLFGSIENEDGVIMNSTSYEIDVHKLYDNDHAIFLFHSDLFKGEVITCDDSDLTICDYYCGSTCHYFRRID